MVTLQDGMHTGVGKNLWPFISYPGHKINKWPSWYENLASRNVKHATLLRCVIMMFFGYPNNLRFFSVSYNAHELLWELI